MGLVLWLLLLLFGFLFYGVPVGQTEMTSATVVAVPPTEAGAGESWTFIEDEDFRGVIVPESDAATFVAEAGWDEAIEYWTPAPENVVALEEEMETAWAELPSAALERFPHPSGHLRQYVGTVVDDQRLIEVNGFCDPVGADWQSEPVVVLDGSACYFRATWDVERGEFLALTVNGEA